MIAKIDWSTTPRVVFGGVVLNVSKYVRNLGILIDPTLSWKYQIQEISRKVFASVGSLRRLRNFLPIATKIALVQSLFLSIHDYAGRHLLPRSH
jgi:hypothetical protein